MPNWCTNYIKFKGDPKEIDTLYNKIDKWTSKNYKENGFGGHWLGNIVAGAGFADSIDNEDPDKHISCRGYLSCMEESYDSEGENGEILSELDIMTETAWCPMLVMWSKVIESLKFKNTTFSSFSEECGSGLYVAYNNPDASDYVIDEFFDGEDYDEYYINNELMCNFVDTHLVNAEDIIDYGNKIFGINEDDVNKVIERFTNLKFKNENSYLKIHEISIMEEMVE